MRKLFAFEDVIHIAGCILVLIDNIGPVRHQTAFRDEVAGWINCRKSMSGRERDNQFAIGDCKSIWQDNECAVCFFGEFGDAVLNMLGVAGAEIKARIQRTDHHPKGSRQYEWHRPVWRPSDT